MAPRRRQAKRAPAGHAFTFTGDEAAQARRECARQASRLPRRKRSILAIAPPAVPQARFSSRATGTGGQKRGRGRGVGVSREETSVGEEEGDRLAAKRTRIASRAVGVDVAMQGAETQEVEKTVSGGTEVAEDGREGKKNLQRGGESDDVFADTDVAGGDVPEQRAGAGTEHVASRNGKGDGGRKMIAADDGGDCADEEENVEDGCKAERSTEEEGSAAEKVGEEKRARANAEEKGDDVKKEEEMRRDDVEKAKEKKGDDVTKEEEKKRDDVQKANEKKRDGVEKVEKKKRDDMEKVKEKKREAVEQVEKKKREAVEQVEKKKRDDVEKAKEKKRDDVENGEEKKKDDAEKAEKGKRDDMEEAKEKKRVDVEKVEEKKTTDEGKDEGGEDRKEGAKESEEDRDKVKKEEGRSTKQEAPGKATGLVAKRQKEEERGKKEWKTGDSGGMLKRVRFSEPNKSYGSINSKSGLLSVVRRKRGGRFSGAGIGSVGGDIYVGEGRGGGEKGRQMLLDELQYLLDGVFKTAAREKGKLVGMGLRVVESCLESLVRLLLRKRKGAGEEEGGVLLGILGGQGDLLRDIVSRLLGMLGRDGVVDMLVGLVVVVVLREKGVLVGEGEVEMVAMAFYGNCGKCLKGGGREGGMEKVNLLLRETGVLEGEVEMFRDGTEGAVHMLGMGLGLLLEKQEMVRGWMRKARRLDRVLAVLLCSDGIVEKKGDDVTGDGAVYTVFRATMRIFEFATLDRMCQVEMGGSRVVGVVVGAIGRIVKGEEEIGKREGVVCSALRLCMNLTQGGGKGLAKFKEAGGTEVVLRCLVRACVEGGLVGEEKEDEMEEEEEEGEGLFDVRVVCLTLLANVVYVDDEERRGFAGLQVGEEDAVGFLLKLLKKVGRLCGEGSCGEKRMERNIMMGYCCLLLGALISGSEIIRQSIQIRMPGQNLLGMAGVLDEFLQFHHEIGIVNNYMDDMYHQILLSLQQP